VQELQPYGNGLSRHGAVAKTLGPLSENPRLSRGIRSAHVEPLKLKRGPNGVLIRPRGGVGYGYRLFVRLTLLPSRVTVNGKAYA
jgi:hypothetical protein